MKEYFLGIMVTVFIGGIIVSVAPDGGSQKYLRFLCGLCVTLCVITPIFSQFKSGENAFEKYAELFENEINETTKYDEIYNDMVLKADIKTASETLRNEIFKEFSADENKLDVNIILDKKSDEYYIDHVEVIIYPDGILVDPHSIEKYVYERLGCGCEFIYE